MGRPDAEAGSDRRDEKPGPARVPGSLADMMQQREGSEGRKRANRRCETDKPQIMRVSDTIVYGEHGTLFSKVGRYRWQPSYKEPFNGAAQFSATSSTSSTWLLKLVPTQENLSLIRGRLCFRERRKRRRVGRCRRRFGPIA